MMKRWTRRTWHRLEQSGGGFGPGSVFQEYADLVARAVRSAIRRTLPAPAHPFELPMRVRCGQADTATVTVRRV